MLATLLFELKYRLQRPATYIYFTILLILGFISSTTDFVQIISGAGKVKANAPYVISQFYLVYAALGMLIISAIMGVPVLRDFMHNTAPLIFTTPYKKWAYLGGRFSGSFLICAFVFSGLAIGFLLGGLIGPYMPWWESSKDLLPFNFIHYIHPFFAHILPVLFILGSMFFAVGTISRRMMIVYVQGVFFLVLYLIVMNFIGNLDNEYLASLFDPFGLAAADLETKYWTTAERNSNLLSNTGVLLQNRLLWFGVAFISLLITYFSFSFKTVKGKKGKAKKDVSVTPVKSNVQIPQVNLDFSFGARFRQLLTLTKLYVLSILKSFPFLAIVLMGLGFIFVSAGQFLDFRGTTILPTTYLILELIGAFNFFFIIIIIFYSGELIWQERDHGMHLIQDATPSRNTPIMLSKLIALIGVILVLSVVLLLAGIIIQATNGHFEFNIPLYLKSLSLRSVYLILLSMLAFFIHTIVNNKFVGHAVMVVFMLFLINMSTIGIEHGLFSFGSGSLGQYSEMNGFGHYLGGFSWFKFYWFAFAVLLFVIVSLFTVRGTDAILKSRLNLAKLRFGRPALILSMLTGAMFLLSGCFIYYNTNVLNKYSNSDTIEEQRANYEKTLKKYEWNAKPKIIKTFAEVDFYPEERDFKAKGKYVLENKTDSLIQFIHVQKGPDYQIVFNKIEFGNGASIVKAFEDFGYTIYKLNRPMSPGDSMDVDWELEVNTEGFVESGSNTDIVENGTFINNYYFPMFGYSTENELANDATRKKYDLKPKERKLDKNDQRGLNMNLFGDSADFIDFEIILSTSKDQIAIAPGYLIREWEEGDRKFFQYKMDKPMANFYSMVSARYEVRSDEWVSPEGEKVNLEIYYHKGHEFNLDRMMDGLKKSLDYYTANFSPYQFRQLRIMEFPRYRTFAQSFANTIPFSEGIGFMQNQQEDEVDMTFYVTCHEVAHQWWGHQVMEADVKGSSMLSESLSQYSALMVMKSIFTTEQMNDFLRHELNTYLMGRATESKKEMPIAEVENQQYIHYNKGSLLLYALQDYIGEENVNAALRDFIADYGFKAAPYPTTDDLIQHFDQYTPDSLKYLINDMFYEMTLFNNRVVKSEYKEIEKGKFEIELDVYTEKLLVDSLGNETKEQINDWIDIGIYTMSKGENVLIYHEKHRFTEDSTNLKFTLDRRPYEVGIDPLNILIDRRGRDNRLVPKEI